MAILMIFSIYSYIYSMCIYNNHKKSKAIDKTIISINEWMRILFGIQQQTKNVEANERIITRVHVTNVPNVTIIDGALSGISWFPLWWTSWLSISFDEPENSPELEGDVGRGRGNSVPDSWKWTQHITTLLETLINLFYLWWRSVCWETSPQLFSELFTSVVFLVGTSAWKSFVIFVNPRGTAADLKNDDKSYMIQTRFHTLLSVLRS